MSSLKKSFLILPLLAIAACTDVEGSTRTLKAMNLEPVSVGGYSWFGCSEDDWYKTKFTAKNAQGYPVSGQVCAGMFFKGATIRLN